MQTAQCFLIDDDPDDQEIFMMALEDVGKKIDCICASNCVEALEKLHNEPDYYPDYIFVDINMPKLNGIECLKAIKKLDRLKHVPVYMYSTSADPKIISESKQLGAADFIVKPTTVGKLTSILSTLFPH